MNSNPMRNYSPTQHEEVLTKALQEAKDPHVAVACWLLEIPEDQVTKEIRMQMKAINFHLLYSERFMKKVLAEVLNKKESK